MEGLESEKLPSAASWSTVPRPSVVRLAAGRPEAARGTCRSGGEGPRFPGHGTHAGRSVSPYCVILFF